MACWVWIRVDVWLLERCESVLFYAQIFSRARSRFTSSRVVSPPRALSLSLVLLSTLIIVVGSGMDAGKQTTAFVSRTSSKRRRRRRRRGIFSFLSPPIRCHLIWGVFRLALGREDTTNPRAAEARKKGENSLGYFLVCCCNWRIRVCVCVCMHW